MQRPMGLGLFFAMGIAVLFFMVPQTPENVRKYLEKNGYSNAQVSGPLGSCGKSKSKFSFTALSSNARRVSGEVCADAFPFLYSVWES